MARNQNVTQLRVVGHQTTLREGQNVEEVELFDSAGHRVDLSGISGMHAAADVVAVATVNATDLATALTLVNQLKTTVNALLAALKASGEEL